MSPKERKKMDSAIIIAIIGLIGTLLAGLLSSPLLLELIERNSVTETPPALVTDEPAPVTTSPDTPTEAPVGTNEVLVFNADFEDNAASGFGFDHGNWQVGKDKSNFVLEAQSDTDFSSATFGPNDFDNGIIEFRIRFEQAQNEGGMILFFRSTDSESYAIYLMRNQLLLGNHVVDADQQVVPFDNSAVRAFTFTQGTWYTVRVEARGSQMIVSIDGNRLVSARDTRLKKGSLLFSLDPGWQATFDDISVWALQP